MRHWPHQTHALDEIQRLMAEGRRRICLTSPTGGGKSLIIAELCCLGLPTIVLSNRKLLQEQLFETMDERGISHGVLASGYAPDIMQDVQIASTQSVSKWWNSGQLHLPDAKLVIVDEIHNEKGTRMAEILDEYHRRGATTIVVTATPIGIGHFAAELVLAGKPSELRDCGALIPAITYAPDEPDPRAFKEKTAGILQLKDAIKERMMRTIAGRVLDHYPIHNPHGNPTFLFAPGVPESLMFANKFWNAGVPAAHIDANKIWINGEALPATRENRAMLREASKTGRIQVLCNRFVLREGANYPWLAHGILACTFGSLCTYIQAVGRLLRSYPGIDQVTVADHGGNFWRSGSVNDDREWLLEEDERILHTKHTEMFRAKNAIEPTPCPKCGRVRRGPGKCPGCGYLFAGKQRNVIQTNGTLKLVRGDIYKERRYSDKPELGDKWVKCVFRCKNSGRTMAQARGLFMYENWGYSPAPYYSYMPHTDAEWCLKVKDFLHQKTTLASLDREYLDIVR